MSTPWRPRAGEPVLVRVLHGEHSGVWRRGYVARIEPDNLLRADRFAVTVVAAGRPAGTLIVSLGSLRPASAVDRLGDLTRHRDA